MFDFAQYEKQKLERAKFLNVTKISIGPASMPISADQRDWDLQDQHIRAIMTER